ncbi:tryptophan--tRNA ligase, partial [bacterium F11]
MFSNFADSCQNYRQQFDLGVKEGKEISMKKRVFSGIQPTGVVHLGNYIGALKNWVAMQEEYDCLYCIVDLHAITVPQNPEELHNSILRTAATTLAVGVDPTKSLLFVQSDVPEHAELAWILNCFVYYGELGQMTQFKDKAKIRGVGTSTGLFTYPVLMTSDILLYNTHAVPVGDDQRQHLELSRLTARRINKQYPNFFIVPQPFIGTKGARIMGLDDPTAKMSKTASTEMNYISFSDSPDVIRKKIKRAVTDSGSEIEYDEEKKPAISNLLSIYSGLTGETTDALVSKYKGKGYGDFKKELAEVVVDVLGPIQKKTDSILTDKATLQKQLKWALKKPATSPAPK